MVKGRTRKFLIGGVFCGILMTAFCQNAGATDFEMSIKSQLTVDFPSLILIDASPSRASIQTTNAKFKVVTNNEDGYIAIFSVDGSSAGSNDTLITSLIKTDQSATIPTLTAPQTRDTFPVGYWGYSIDGGENYRGITAYNDENRLVISSNQAGTDTETDFTFGVRINDLQPSGIYTSVLLITTVANMNEVPEPADVGAKALLGTNGRLVFTYNDKEYNAGELYTDGTGSMEISRVYNVPLTSTDNPLSTLGWIQSDVRGNITAVDFTSQFYNFQPVSTRGWFQGLTNLSRIGGIENLNTSRTLDMSYMFYNTFQTNTQTANVLGDLAVSNVTTNMKGMFSGVGDCNSSSNCKSMQIDFSNWDTSSVTDMSSMFANFSRTSEATNVIGLEDLDVSSVTNMANMFAGAFGSQISGWDYSIGAYRVGKLDFDFSRWDVSSVTNMANMFANGFFGGTVDYMVTINVSGWHMQQVRNIDNMFNHTSYNVTILASGWVLSGLQSLSGVFDGAGKWCLVADLHDWDVSTITQFNSLFYNDSYDNGYSSYNIKSRWDVNAKDWIINNNIGDGLVGLFSGASKYARYWSLDVSGWNTSGATSLARLFSENGNGYNGSGTWSLNVTGWDTSNVTDMTGMLSYSAMSNQDITIVGIGDWNTSSLTNAKDVFCYFGSSEERENSSFSVASPKIERDYYDSYRADYRLSNWDLSRVVDTSRMFFRTRLSAPIVSDINAFDTDSLVYANAMFAGAYLGAETDLTGWDVSHVVDMSDMFSHTSIKGEYINLTGWDTSNVADMSGMFNYFGRGGVDSIMANAYNELRGLKGWDVSSVQDMSNMFSYARLLPSVDLSGWVTSSLANASEIFRSVVVSNEQECSIDLSGWDVSHVTNMSGAFRNACDTYNDKRYGLPVEIDLTGWNTVNVKDMSYMFDYSGISYNDFYGDNSNYWKGSYSQASSVTIIGLSEFNTSNVTNMSHMFECFGLFVADWTLDLTSWDTGNVTDMSSMFSGIGWAANSIVLDLSNFDTSNVRNMSYMFGDHAGVNATTFNVNLGTWDVSRVTDHTNFASRDMLEPAWVN